MTVFSFRTIAVQFLSVCDINTHGLQGYELLIHALPDSQFSMLFKMTPGLCKQISSF